ncbi:MAG: hypothetical protein F4X42_11115 [Rhodospirillaceae bacterium]|nr:hypothetical protein [Rhodospirillaceae bacterium]
MTGGRNFEDPAAAPDRAPGPEASRPGSPRQPADPPADPPPDFPPDFPGPLDPDHPQWLRRRKKLNILFGASLATFLGVGLAAIANMVRGLPVDPNAASVMWPLGSATAAAAGLYVWQGVRRSDGGGWRHDRWGGHRDGHR